MLHLVHEAAHTLPLMSLRTSLIPLQGVLHMMLGGVTLYINAETEESYMDLAPGFEKEIAVILTKEIPQLGYEVMTEVGSIEELEDGTIRNYIAQTWFPEIEEKEMEQAS